MTVAVTRNDKGKLFVVHNIVENSAGSAYTVQNTIRKSDGTSFTIFTVNVDTTTPIGKVYFAIDAREFLA